MKTKQAKKELRDSLLSLAYAAVDTCESVSGEGFELGLNEEETKEVIEKVLTSLAKIK